MEYKRVKYRNGYDKRYQCDDEISPWHNLAAAIIHLGVLDARKLKREGAFLAPGRMVTEGELESFFFGEWFETLTDFLNMSRDEILRRIDI